MTKLGIVNGTPENHDLKLEQIEADLYGLTYTGLWGCKAWCYVAVGPDAAVFCQPLREKNGSVGTSITNIWDAKFILAVGALGPIGPRPLYECYFDDSRAPDISRVTYHRGDPRGDVTWKFTGQSFAQIVGRSEPDFRNLEWGQKAAERCRRFNAEQDNYAKGGK